MKIVPFSETAEGRWVGKFGRYDVTILRKVGETFWRGPEKEVVLETDLESYSIAIHGQYSSMAYTLAGAMQEAENACLKLHGSARHEARYAMTEEQRASEEQAHRASMTEAVEADRIAHSRGWNTAIDVLPELKAFAEEQGIYPFPASEPEAPTRPAP